MTRSTRHPSRPTLERPVGAEIDGGRKVRYELIGGGLHGHALVGTDASRVRPEDALFAREDADGLRWHRCMRCDAGRSRSPRRHRRSSPHRRPAAASPSRWEGGRCGAATSCG